jgi:hypothetical protein
MLSLSPNPTRIRACPSSAPIAQIGQARRNRDNEIAMLFSRDIRGQEETPFRYARDHLDTLFDVGGSILDRRRCDFNSESGRDPLR